MRKAIKFMNMYFISEKTKIDATKLKKINYYKYFRNKIYHDISFHFFFDELIVYHKNKYTQELYLVFKF